MHILGICLQDPIKLPLLKKLLSQPDEVQEKAAHAFLDILAYTIMILYAHISRNRCACMCVCMYSCEVFSLTNTHQ